MSLELNLRIAPA